MTKLMHTTLVLGLVLGAALGGSTPAAADVLSPRVARAAQEYQAWRAGERIQAPAFPLYAGAQAHRPGDPPGLAALSAGETPRLRLLAVTDDVEALRAAGAEVSTVAGRVAVFEIDAFRLEELEGVSGLRSVTFPMPLSPSLDVSSPEINVPQIHGSLLPPYGGYTGQGVVVGTIDTGIDPLHNDFKNDDGTTRITYLWDQTVNGTPKPPGYAYGTEWTAATINSGAVTERDTDGHGTHVTGISAGNGRATGNSQPQYTYVGVAPEADIIVCKTTFLTTDVIDAINWLQGRAGSQPCVINLSLGGQMGPHDGTDPFDIALEGLSGPGRIIVAAVGNDGGSGIHAEAQIPGSGTLDITFQIPSYTPNGSPGSNVILLDGWYADTGNLTVSLISPNSAQVTAPASTQYPINTGDADNSADGYMFLGQGRYAVNSSRFFESDIWDNTNLGSQPPASGSWTVRCQNMTTTATEIDIWISYSSLPTDVTWSSHVDDTELVSSPASSDSVLAVSAYVTKQSWKSVNGGTYGYGSGTTVGEIAFFSSPGPLRNGGQKPDISAPGMGIGSSKSANATSPLFNATNITLQDGKHVISQGTSQASPHVAGVAALMLEANPMLAMKDLRNRMAATARHDSFTGMGWSPLYGHGKVDALAALNMVVPVRFLTLSADWVDGSAVVSWTLRETEAGARFQVERSPAATGPFRDVSGPVYGDRELSWTDPSPDATEPWYRVTAFQRDGTLERYGPVHLEPVAAQIRLWQNAPNPFTSGTVIAFELDRARPVRLDVVDVSGRLVTTLLEGEQAAGRHDISWDGVDSAGRPSAAGVYFARLTTAASIQVRRMVLAH